MMVHARGSGSILCGNLVLPPGRSRNLHSALAFQVSAVSRP